MNIRAHSLPPPLRDKDPKFADTAECEDGRGAVVIHNVPEGARAQRIRDSRIAHVEE